MPSANTAVPMLAVMPSNRSGSSREPLFKIDHLVKYGSADEKLGLRDVSRNREEQKFTDDEDTPIDYIGDDDTSIDSFSDDSNAREDDEDNGDESWHWMKYSYKKSDM